VRKGNLPLDLIKFSPQRGIEINSRDVMKNLENISSTFPLPSFLFSPSSMTLPCIHCRKKRAGEHTLALFN